MSVTKAWCVTVWSDWEKDESYHKELLTWCEEAIENNTLTYGIVGKEKGSDSNKPHLQCFFKFKKNQRLTGVKSFLHDNKAHCEVMQGTAAQASNYCKKDKNFTEWGVLDARDGNGENSKEYWENIWTACMEGRLEDVPAKVRLLHYDKVMKVYADGRKSRIKKLDESESRANANYWLVGGPNIGKTFCARHLLYPTLGVYYKGTNKWFMGYDDEPVVVIDDLDPWGEHAKNVKLYKDLGDAEPFWAETKGGGMPIRPKHVVITSNHTIDEVFASCSPADREAIHTRFKEIRCYRRAEPGVQGLAALAQMSQPPETAETAETLTPFDFDTRPDPGETIAAEMGRVRNAALAKKVGKTVEQLLRLLQ